MKNQRIMFKFFAVWLYFILLFIPAANSQILLDQNFENGRLDTAYFSNGSYHLWPVTNLHARVTGVNQQQPVFSIFDSVGYQLRSYHYMVYRYASDTTWQFFDTAYKAGTTSDYSFWNHQPFVRDTVFIAYWYPYTYSQLSNYLSNLASNPYLISNKAVGHSYEGRNLYGLEITDTSFTDCYKKNVVITARQHPIENINGYFVEGLINYLLDSRDTIADFLRRNYRFFIYPMLNPDGVFHGSGQNALGQGLNREWEDSLKPGGTPEIDTIRPVIWRQTGQQVDWSIDIHSNPGSNIPYYWWGYTSGSQGVSANHIYQAGSLVSNIAQEDTKNSGPGLFQFTIQGNGVSNSKTAANWFRKSFDAIAFTFEPTSEPLGPTGDNRILKSRMKAAGASIAKGFYHVFDTVQNMHATLHQFTDTLVVEATGGLPPYSYQWNGPQNSTNDTLLNAQPGTYTVSIIDQSGCQWKGNINVTFTSLPEKQNHRSNHIAFPNPVNEWLMVRNPGANGARYKICNLSGKTLLAGIIDGSPIAVKHLSPGLYFLTIESTRGWHSILLCKPAF